MEAADARGHPPLFRRHARRPRLTRLLDESRAQAILITAPAGYGKTTLALEWLQGRERVVWYRATNASADVAAFSAGLSDVLAPLVPRAGERLKQRLRVADTPERAARPLAELLAEDISGWPDDGLLVIDDYHLVADSAPVEDFFDWLLTLASHLRVLVTSRRRPRWASARRILYGEIAEIGRDQLAMTAEEAGRVLEDRSTGSVRALVAQAEGWPAIIGLAALTASEEIPSERVSDALYRYFAEEVVRREAPEVERFMLLSSVPAAVDARIARAVLQTDEPELILERLADEGLLNPAENQLRFHPLLRAFLRQRFRLEEPARYVQLTERAIEDAKRGERWEEAFELAVEVEHGDTAMDILELATAQMLASGQVEVLDRWLAACGPESLEHPGSVVARVEILTRRGELDVAARTANHVVSRFSADDAHTSRLRYLAGRAYHLMSKESEALECHLSARASAKGSHDISNALWGAYLAAEELGHADAIGYLNELEKLNLPDIAFRLRVATGRMASAASRGSLKGVADIFEPLQPLIGHAGDPLAESSFLTRVAEVEIIRGRYRGAQAFATQALSIAETLHLGFARPLCLVPLTAAEVGLRRFRSARESLSRLTREISSNHDPYLDLARRILEVRLAISGEPYSYEADHDAGIDESVQVSSRGEYLGLLALDAARNRQHEVALTRARGARETTKAVEARYFSSFAELLVTHHLRANSESVSERLAGLITSANSDEARDAIVLTFRADPTIAERLPKHGRVRELVAQALLLSSDRAIAERMDLIRPNTIQTGHDLLTPREREVLDLLEQGLSNAAIAARLFISVSTAKVHVHHVLAKLGVTSRLQAALRASERARPPD